MTSNRLRVRADAPGARIDKNIYGHFAEHLGRCIYEGFWVGEDSPIPHVRGIRTDVVEALRRLRVPVLRWPGGCFADEYHWMDGIGPRAARPAMVNTHWGQVMENNHFGTHEFFDLCELLGADPYICGNVGSGTVQEMQQWVEYATFAGTSPMAALRRRNGREQPWRLAFFGVGNENWGCGGSMRPEYYADLYRCYHGLQGFACSSTNLSLARAKEARWPGCVSLDAEGLAWHRHTQMPLFSWSAQAGGFFTGRYAPDRADDADIVRVYDAEDNWERLRRARELAAARGVSATQIALAYVLHQLFPAFPIMDPLTLEEFRVSVAVDDIALSPSEVRWLNLEAETLG